VLQVLYHHAKFGGARISPAAGVAKNVEFFVWYLVYSEADFEVFRHAGATRCTDGYDIFGMEEGTPSVQHKGVGHQKLKFILRFDQNVEYKRRGVSIARFSQN